MNVADDAVRKIERSKVAEARIPLVAVTFIRGYAPISNDTPIFHDVSRHREMPPSCKAEEMIVKLREKERNFGVKFCACYNDTFYDIELLKRILELHQLKEEKVRVISERQWAGNVRNGIIQPEGTRKLAVDALLTKFIDILQSKSLDHHYSSLGLKVDHLTTLVGDRWVEDCILNQVANLINRASQDTFAYLYNNQCDPVSMAGYIKNECKEQLPENITFCVNVGISGNHTFLGNTVIQNEPITGCHYAVGVYNKTRNALFYGDSKGWPIPSIVKRDFRSCISLLFGENVGAKMTVSLCHSQSFDKLSDSFNHQCTEHCWKHFPLQTCNSICGISAAMSMSLASFDFDAYLSLKGNATDEHNKYSYLKNVTKYGTFLRLTLIQWILENKIDIFQIQSTERCHSQSTDATTLDNSFEDGLNSEASSTVGEELSEAPSCQTVFSIETTINTQSFISACEGVKLCNVSKQHFHCNLCPKSKTWKDKWSLKKHLGACHLNEKKCIKYRDLYVLPCKVNHPGIKYSRDNTPHFHCPICERSVQTKAYFLKHLDKHKEPNQQTANVGAESRQKARSHQQTEVLSNESGESHVSGQQKTNRHQPNRIRCDLCKRFFHKNSFKRHYELAHSRDVSVKAVCCDLTHGIYMVRKHLKGGVGFPIHVAKKLQPGSESYLGCQVDDCRYEMQLARRAGIGGRECKHLLLVNDASHPEIIQLREETLQELCATNRFKALSVENVGKCLEKKVQADAKGSPLVVEWVDGNYIHLSVFDGKYGENLVRLRCIVSFDKANHKLSCRCSNVRYFCIHKSLSLWYLHQTDQLGTSETDIQESEQNFPEMIDETAILDDEMNEIQNETTSSSGNFSSNVYPPSSEETLLRMSKYIFDKKRIPVSMSENIKKMKLSDFPKILKPTEENCNFCKIPLSSPIRITYNASVLTMNGVVENIETFCRKCSQCNCFYRYQEIEDGILNFDDKFLVGFDVCLFFRECVKQHVAIGTGCSILGNLLGKDIDEKKCLDAYLFFEALTDHSYAFNCVICGFHPPILIGDLNRKIVFKCPNIDDPLPDETDADADFVDCERFWEKPSLSMVLNGFSGANVESLKLKPKLTDWAPFIGKNTRCGKLLVNSEHRKIKRDNGDLEMECRELSQERLIELLHQGKLPEIKQTARRMGVSAGGSKLDIINRVQDALQRDIESTRFNKIFKKMGGCSGGWLTLACPHSVIYGVKFLLRAESPRDYIDMLKSMKHRPNILICDMAHLVASHGNKNIPDFFRPFDGRVAADTPQNVALASSDELSLSFPWLTDESPVDDNLDSTSCHPVTGSDVRMSLFDVFHQGNTCSEKESLRRIACVKELKGVLNSQVCEQTHRSFNFNMNFLNRMTPVRHIFLFRTLIHLRNETKNRQLLEKVSLTWKVGISFDRFGRASFSTGSSNRGEVPNAHFINLPDESHRVEAGREETESSDIQATFISSPENVASPVGHSQATFICSPENVASPVGHSQATFICSPENVASPVGHSQATFISSPENVASPVGHSQATFISSPENVASPVGHSQATFISSPENVASPVGHSQATFISSPENVASPVGHSQATFISSPENVASPVIQATTISSPETVPGPIMECENSNLNGSAHNFNRGDEFDTGDSDISVSEMGVKSSINPKIDAQIKKGKQIDARKSTNSLSAEQRSIIARGQPLSTEIVNAAMSILKSENKTVGGLQSILNANSFVGNGRPFVQILQQNDSTWITLSNVCSEKDKLTLYDAAQRLHFSVEDPKEIVYDDSLPAHAQNLSGNVLLQKLVIEIAATQQTGKDADTGIASIFSAVCLCRGLDPKNVVFHFKSLRKILLECIEKESFAGVHFNSSPKKSVKPKFVIEVDLYCHCNMPESGYMIECPNCKRWYHELCESGDYDSAKWVCKNCLKGMNVSHNKMHRKRKRPLDKGNKGNSIEKKGKIDLSESSWKKLTSQVSKTSFPHKTVNEKQLKLFLNKSFEDRALHKVMIDVDNEVRAMPVINNYASYCQNQTNESVMKLIKYSFDNFDSAHDIIRAFIQENFKGWLDVNSKGISRLTVLSATLLDNFFLTE